MSHSSRNEPTLISEEAPNHGNESYASSGEQQWLCQGPAADVFLASYGQTRVVKKVMRVVPTYFDEEATPSGQKRLDKLRADFSEAFGRWYHLQSSGYIAKLFFVDTKELTLYEEHFTHGNLRQYSEMHMIDLNECHIILLGITEGLKYLHSQRPPIVHGCVNPGNIYITSTINSPFKSVKLGEPSCSQLVVEASHLTPSISVDWLVRWMSPEFFEAGSLTTQSDIWSLGCTFLEVITGRLPYYRFKSNTEVLRQILANVPPDLGECREAIRDGLSHNYIYTRTIYRLAKKCWLPAPNRPLIETVQTRLQLANFEPGSGSLLASLQAGTMADEWSDD